MNLNLLAGLAVGLGTLGQFADGFTTYIGVHVKKVAVEGDKDAGWIANNKFLCLTFKPALFALCGGALVYVNKWSPNDGADIMAFIFSGAAAFLGFYVAKGNAKINGGWF